MVGSLMWTAEEAKYLKAVLHWQETAASEDEKRQQQAEEEARRRHQQQRQPAGEFRILVVGARGTGKTALLTRMANKCKEETYLLEAREFPSQHLLSNPKLAQALSTTEAAVLVYSVRDRASFRLALVGTKCDLQEPDTEADADTDQERAVSFAEGLKAAQGMKTPGSGSVSSDVPFLEVSARTGAGVDRVFRVVAAEVLRARRAARARREQAERERMMRDLMEITKAGGGGGGAAEGGRKRFSLWRALALAFGRRRVLVGR
ncbi:P-loop containing nucleoside triphosphate hydrolase protein [Chaetomium strumarium]|uniref:P-loop containing nucleoside triphosphate hydrolase protein n=1 Tax=Chaetomium strumarium TaxID=1170767 RepID=A0AAJ0M503_9PEZI|nr:P-loop containing nucleoside triphosphate hydrolase protein [Chaetomium strumarium]